MTRFFRFVNDVKKPSASSTASIFSTFDGSLMIFATETNPALHAESAMRFTFAPRFPPALRDFLLGIDHELLEGLRVAKRVRVLVRADTHVDAHDRHVELRAIEVSLLQFS